MLAIDVKYNAMYSAECVHVCEILQVLWARDSPFAAGFPAGICSDADILRFASTIRQMDAVGARQLLCSRFPCWHLLGFREIQIRLEFGGCVCVCVCMCVLVC